MQALQKVELGIALCNFQLTLELFKSALKDSKSQLISFKEESRKSWIVLRALSDLVLISESQVSKARDLGFYCGRCTFRDLKI